MRRLAKRVVGARRRRRTWRSPCAELRSRWACFVFVCCQPMQCVENMLMVKSLAQNAGAGLRLSDMVENMMMVKRLAQNTGAGGLVL